MLELFQLPTSTKVHRNIPKNSFDEYTNAKQKKLLTDLVYKITWQNKLAPDTVNLSGKVLEEIQIIEVNLKRKQEIPEILELIDKVTPYAIIFVVRHGEEYYLSASIKHLHPVKVNHSVIDWTFQSEWLTDQNPTYQLKLRENLDFVFFDFCKQLSGFANDHKLKSLTALADKSRLLDQLLKEVKKLKSALSSCKQYNRKVELNLELNEVLKKLDILKRMS